MRVILKIFIIFFLLFINLFPDDDEIQCTHLTAEDGLSLNIVTEILQDSRGFLWFGTYDGLNRYDGYNFKLFLPEPSNPNSISGQRNAVLEKRIAERTQDLDRIIQELSQEISERKKAESKVQASLEEKEILLKEIYHRVKNNLQIISSLLYPILKKLNDGKMLDTFRVSQNRIKSIALVHERLCQSKDLAKINFKEYVQRLANDLFRSYALNQCVITFELDIEDILISMDSAVSFELIINELVSNSLRHAFTNFEEEKKSGLIKINFRKNEKEEYVLEVSDNGVGILDDFDERKKNSLGLQLIETLVARLEAVLEIRCNPGTLFRIKFKNDKGIL